MVTVASCGGYEELEGPGAAQPVEQVSSAIVFDHHDYLFFRQQATWTAATLLVCADTYRVARINSAAENEFVRLEAAHHAPGTWWIGFSDQKREGLWLWENSEPVGYVNWAPGEPRNITGNEDCALMDTSTGQWSAAPCASGSTFPNVVCERNGNEPLATDSFSYQANDTNNATRNYFQYAVNMARNQRITFGTCGVANADNEGDTFLRLFSPGGIELSFNDDACGVLASNLSYRVPADGTYYIHAGCFGDGACGGAPVAIRVGYTNN
jgi:hypothetical protein